MEKMSERIRTIVCPLSKKRVFRGAKIVNRQPLAVAPGLLSGVNRLNQTKAGNLIDTNQCTLLFQYGHGESVAAQHRLPDNFTITPCNLRSTQPASGRGIAQHNGLLIPHDSDHLLRRIRNSHYLRRRRRTHGCEQT